MNKLYVFGPLAGLVVFGAAYWKFEQGFESRQAEHERQLRAAVDDKLQQNAAAQAKARQEAEEARLVRVRERAEAAALAEAQQQARAEAERQRTLAFERARKLQGQVERLRFEAENVRSAVAAAEENQRVLRAEHTFLLQCVDEAEANRKAFFQLLEKLERIERAHPKTGAPNQPSA